MSNLNSVERNRMKIQVSDNIFFNLNLLPSQNLHNKESHLMYKNVAKKISYFNEVSK